MPWLIVTGSGGSWGAGRNLPTFKPGVYEVTEEVAEIARRDAPERVFVSAVRPELATCHEGAPLTLEDIRVGVDYGVRLRQDDAPADPDQDDEYVEPERLPDAYPCQFCTRSFATGERLDWHVEYAHSIHHE